MMSNEEIVRQRLSRMSTTELVEELLRLPEFIPGSPFAEATLRRFQDTSTPVLLDSLFYDRSEEHLEAVIICLNARAAECGLDVMEYVMECVGSEDPRMTAPTKPH